MSEHDKLWQKLDTPDVPGAPPVWDEVNRRMHEGLPGSGGLTPAWLLLARELPRSRAGMMAALAIVAGVGGGLFGSRMIMPASDDAAGASLESEWWGPLPGSLSWEYLQPEVENESQGLDSKSGGTL